MILSQTPKVFGKEHLIYLIVSFILTIIAVILITIFIKDENKKKITRRSIGLILLFLIIYNRICVSIHNDNWWFLLPTSYCGITSLILSIGLIWAKKDNFIFHFFPYVGIVGGIGALLYPDFLSQNSSFFYPATISGLLHHSVCLFASILCFTSSYFTPTLKKWYIPIISYIIVLALGFFELYILKLDNPFNLSRPLVSGTILNWWFVSILVFLASYLVMLFYDIFNKKSLKN